MKRRTWLPGGLGRFGPLMPVVAVLRMGWWTAQLLDGWVYAGLKRFIGTRYERTGGCAQSGVCCEIIAMELPQRAQRWGWLRRFLSRLGEVLYPFHYERQEEDKSLYTCYNFDPERRTCRNYRFRPRVCREYPEVGYFSRPHFYKGCGFGVRLRGKKGSFVEALDSVRRRED